MSTQPYMKGKNNTAVTGALTKVLADTFVLYFKTHSFHWNVVGPRFHSLHEMFGEQYTEMWEATDEIAERIRALDAYAPNSYSECLKIASLSEAGQTPDAEGMVQALANDNRAIVDTLRAAMQIAEEAGDEVTTDMCIGRITVHEKTAWMLESSLKS